MKSNGLHVFAPLSGSAGLVDWVGLEPNEQCPSQIRFRVDWKSNFVSHLDQGSKNRNKIPKILK